MHQINSVSKAFTSTDRPVLLVLLLLLPAPPFSGEGVLISTPYEEEVFDVTMSALGSPPFIMPILWCVGDDDF